MTTLGSTDARTLSRRGLLLAAGVGLAATALPAGASPARPNIVWFRSEDNHAEFIGAYGSTTARTPTIDRLAREGVRCANAFSTSPVCAPTKLGVLTGLHETSLGPGHHMRALGKRPSFAVGFARYLQDVGYWTTTSGNTDYNTSIGGDSGYADTTGNWKARPAGAPFFALLGSSTTHETNVFAPVPPRTTDPAAVRIPAYQPDTPTARADRARYQDAVNRMDGEVAQLLADLAAEGELEDTIVLYGSDHGGVLPRSKRFCYDSGLRTPLVVWFPPRWRHLAPAAPGSVHEAPVSSIDMPPTLLGLAGVTAPAYMHGQAFAGPAARPRRYAFSGRNRMDEAIDVVRSVHDGRYHYLRNYMPHLPHGQHVQFMWLQAGVREWEQLHRSGDLPEVQQRFWREKPVEELYDTQADPDEVVDLVDDPQHQGRLRRMRAALDEHMLRTNDNAFIPEGMAAEGWDASRAPGAYPLARLLDLTAVCLRRDPASLPVLLEALRDENEVVRYWGAVGLSMLDAGAAPAAPQLEQARTGDPSPWVRAQAADALTRAGSTDAAVPFLGALVVDASAPMSVRLQAVWSLARLGPRAVAALPQLVLAGARQGAFDDYPAQAARYAARVVSGTYVPAP